MVKLSVVIITLNEEKNIGRCLESVKDIADDIVVVDSGSTDNTIEICHRFKARVINILLKAIFNRKTWLSARQIITIYSHLMLMKHYQNNYVILFFLLRKIGKGMVTNLTE